MVQETNSRQSINIAQPELSAHDFISELDEAQLLFRARPHTFKPTYYFPTESLLQRHRSMYGEPVWLTEFKAAGQGTFLERNPWQAERRRLPTLRISPSTFEKTLYFLYSKYAFSMEENPYVYPQTKLEDPGYRQIKGELMHESDALFGAIIQEVTDPNLLNESLRYRYGKTKELRAHLIAVFENIVGLKLPPRNNPNVKETIEETRQILYAMWKLFYAQWVPTTFPQLAWSHKVPDEYIQQMFQDVNMLAIAWARAYVGWHNSEHMLYADQYDVSPLYHLRTRRALRAQVSLNPYPFFNHVFLNGEFDGLTIYRHKGQYEIQVDEFKSSLFEVPKSGIEHDILMRQFMLYGLMAQAIVDPMQKYILSEGKAEKPIDEGTGVYWGHFNEQTTDRPCTVVLRMLDRKKGTFVTHTLNVNDHREEMIEWLHWFVAAYEAYYPEIQQIINTAH